MADEALLAPLAAGGMVAISGEKLAVGFMISFIFDCLAGCLGLLDLFGSG
jgi:hypothetical protein